MKKIIILIGSIILPIIVIGIVVLVACLMVLDFFGVNSTDGYVENNMAYASDYKKVLNENILNGYVPLERILYFRLADENLSYSKIYNDNLDYSLKIMKPITEVCSQTDYEFLFVCSTEEIENSNQHTEYQNKPFGKPIDFSKTTITSFFMEQRIVFGTEEIHKAWDLASSAQTEVYSVCDGVVERVSFPYSENVTDKSGGGGNQIVIKCLVDDIEYKVSYYHLYPNSSNVSVGDTITKGQVLAGVGTTGYSTGNHLHYQVQLDDNTYVDGMSLIDFTDETIPSIPEYHPPSSSLNFGN